ncbi:ATPase [Deefgea piscis]|uniref:ATPase n=1 Tax=Deefgea piscis TaxID=2739061 RepID=A0A6M8SRI5_9NEIS|nr:ATPase [Deefgea piscis]QKJ67963.1 ATPase [Deefgea piscis]
MKTDYIFKRNSSIGAADAESDSKFLVNCFVDNGDLEVLQDCQNPKRIVVGRTGAGKSALLSYLKEIEPHVIELMPESLALNYISNSDVIKFFESAGVNLDVFYQLLWKHVFTVELLKKHFKISQYGNDNFLNFLGGIFKKDKKKERGMMYLQQWGSEFWQETEYRIKEFTTKLEADLKSSLGSEFGGVKFGADAARKMSDEMKAEVVHKAQKVVNQVQIRELMEVIALLSDDVFNDHQKRYFITIDRLDENWVDERLRYKVIRALIETVRVFQKIKSVKIVISIREDLLLRVFEKTRDSGFQEEKYDAMFLRVRWKSAQLKKLVDSRVSYLVREQYTKRDVLFDDVFPSEIRKVKSFDYMAERTLYRPRDIIAFTNECLELCEGKASVPPSMVQDAEAKYSRGRLNSLADEWYSDFPNLSSYAQILNGRNYSFKFSDILQADLESLLVDSWADLGGNDGVYKSCQDWLDGKKSLNNILASILKILYKVSLIGIKPQGYDRVFWSYNVGDVVSDGQYKSSSMLYVHPMFWRVLGVIPPARGQYSH